jgi:hypothetical protein
VARTNWQRTSDEKQAGIVLAIIFSTLGLTVGTTLTIFKLTTIWNPPWTGITAPVWVPVVALLSLKLVHTISKRWVDYKGVD